jgi:hypothetical protein
MVPPRAPCFVGGGDMWWRSGGSAIPPEPQLDANWRVQRAPIGQGPASARRSG